MVMLQSSAARRSTRFLLVAAALAVLYLATVPVLWWSRGVLEDGPLSFTSPSLRTPLLPEQELGQIEERCEAQQAFSSASYERIKIVGGRVDGRVLYACYGIQYDGAVTAAAVLDQDLFLVKDAALIKRSGAWRWIGAVKTPLEAVLGFLGLLAVLAMYFLYYRRPRPAPRPGPGRRFWQGRGADIAFWFLPVVGWIAVWVLPGRSRARKIRLSFLYTFAYIPLFMIGVFGSVTDYPDLLSAVVVGILSTALVWGWLGGRALVRAEGWGYPDELPVAQAPTPQPWSPAAPVAFSQPATGSAAPARPIPDAAALASVTPPASGLFKVQQSNQLPTFANVGGMVALKDMLADTFGLLLAFSEQAESYRITFNGVLLHGPSGVGKTFIAKATAGEFALNFVHVTSGELISKWLGESARNVAEVFRVAATNVPCLLLFDEFDSVARRREDDPDNESRRVVNQLLTSLEEYRTVSELIVMAATNRLEQLDPAVVRPGRFDRHIRVDLPDSPARRAVLAAQLRGRPVVAGVDLDLLADRTEGLTPAALTAVVEAAALAAFRESTTAGQSVPITTEGLLGALMARGGTDRPAATAHTWDDVVLDDRTKAELKQLQRLIEDPEVSRKFGIDPPSGLLLAGPPGTGKTTIARVLAAQARCSFYSVSAADLTSKWVGESEQRIQTLFARARDNAPSIVFLDELDAIARKRLGGHDIHDRQLTQLLAEIDGLGSRPGVFVIGATNRPDMLDPAITRGGRLSRTVVVPLPNHDARLSILGIYSRRMPLAGVNLEAVAGATEGFSGGDLEAVCQQAAVQALMRAGASNASGGDTSKTEVGLEDFAAAVVAIRASKKFVGATRPPGR
jgi:transitional endoplasmic reticulum ATPase